MTITSAVEKKIRSILENNLLTEEQLEDEEPWGEDGSIYAFEKGQEHGAHDLAEEILALLDKNK